MLRVFAKFVSFVERLRSLIPTVGFVSFVQFVVETKNMIVFDNKRPFQMKEPCYLCAWLQYSKAHQNEEDD